MNETQGPYTVVPYDPGCRPLPPISIEHSGAGGLEDAWEMVRLALPPRTQAFAVYDRDGALARIGMVPAEPLTDDPDVRSMAFDYAGNWVATGHEDGNVRLWDVVTGDPLWTRAPADESILGIGFVDTGPWVIAWSDDGPLLVFHQDAGELVLRVEDPQVGAFVATASPECSGIPRRARAPARLVGCAAWRRATCRPTGAPPPSACSTSAPPCCWWTPRGGRLRTGWRPRGGESTTCASRARAR
jgi:hypothetical protein